MLADGRRRRHDRGVTTEDLDAGLDPDLDLGELHAQPHEDEPHQEGFRGRLNWLRAAVLGANDGIVSTAGIVVGVAGATTDRTSILIAGVAGLAAGALSMAAGEYVSVSTQRDSEMALLEKERVELRDEPEEELEELAGIYVAKGLTEDLALQVAQQLTAARRPRRPRRGRAGHRPRRHLQPVDRRMGLDGRRSPSGRCCPC